MVVTISALPPTLSPICGSWMALARLLTTLAYTAADQTVQGVAMLSDAMGLSMPDGFALFVLNYSGAAFDGSGQVIAYKALATAVA